MRKVVVSEFVTLDGSWKIRAEQIYSSTADGLFNSNEDMKETSSNSMMSWRQALCFRQGNL